MLTEIYPRVHRRYSSLPVLGHILGDYADWLRAHGYPVHRIRAHLRAALRLDPALRRRGVRTISELSRERLDRCAPVDSQDDVELAAVATALERYLTDKGVLAPRKPTAVEHCAAAYGQYVRDVRGFATITEKQHVATATRFLTSVSYESNPRSLKRLQPSHVEASIRRTGASWGRAGLQHVVGQLRGFLRFLAANGLAPTGLDAQIDTPRVYRGELLPRSLPWETVRAFLCSIDRSTAPGKRDYAMFLMMATCGLRSIDIVTLKLDDIDWRADATAANAHFQRLYMGRLTLSSTLIDEIGYLSYETAQRTCSTKSSAAGTKNVAWCSRLTWPLPIGPPSFRMLRAPSP